MTTKKQKLTYLLNKTKKVNACFFDSEQEDYNDYKEKMEDAAQQMEGAIERVRYCDDGKIFAKDIRAALLLYFDFEPEIRNAIEKLSDAEMLRFRVKFVAWQKEELRRRKMLYVKFTWKIR